VNVIEVQDVGKSFRVPNVRRDTVREHLLGILNPPTFRRLDVLRSVSFEVRRGESVAIMGRNGSGKSTLLKVLCGIYVPDRGRVVVQAPITPILELGVGWNPDLDAVDNIMLLGTVMGMSLSEVSGATEEILAFAELEAFANLELRHYSSGMASRLAYAVAFRAVREVLVLDEVYAVGDARFKARCEERYRQLKAEGHTVVLVSHDERAVALCDRALLLDGGRVSAAGTPAEIFEAYLQDSTHPAASAAGEAR
jgi:ABC-type polysaccharide/polyol phosphate transport system ATPase subunit